MTEVPLLFALPFRLEPGIAIRERTQNVDLWPTLLDLLGLPPLEMTDGRSLVPQLLAAARGEEMASEPRLAVAHLDRNWGQARKQPRPQVAVALGDHRFVMTTGPRPHEELFDRRGDPFETRDVLKANVELADRLRAEARRYLASTPAWGDGVPTVELGEMELNQLRALGYSLP